METNFRLLLTLVLILSSSCSLGSVRPKRSLGDMKTLKQLRLKLVNTQIDEEYIKLALEEVVLYSIITDLAQLERSHLVKCFPNSYAVNIEKDCMYKKDMKVISTIDLLIELSYDKQKSILINDYFSLGERNYNFNAAILNDNVLRQIEKDYVHMTEEIRAMLQD